MLVNGAWCTLRQWDAVVAPLAERFTVIRHDVRGTGRSPAGPPEENTFEHYADDLVALAAAQGFDRFHLWGMAWGARLALVTAADHPERIDRLLLSDLAIDPADVAAQKAGAVAAKLARASAGVAEAAKVPGAFDHEDREAAGAALAATALQPDLMPFVRRVEASTMVATGDHDPNLASSRRALEGFRDARLEVLPLTAHGSVLQRPDVAVATALDFLISE